MENRILQERNDLRIALAESEAKVAELANERDEAVQLKVYWNALLNQCGAAVNMRAGDAMDSVPECVRSCVTKLEAENEHLRTRFDTLGVAHRRNADEHVKDMREFQTGIRELMQLHVDYENARNTIRGPDWSLGKVRVIGQEMERLADSLLEGTGKIDENSSSKV